MNIYERLINKETKLSVVGLGYVGLPIALEFARNIQVVGFDIKPDRVEMMKNRIDPSEELTSEDFDGCDISFTCNPEDLKEATFHVVAVPTPIDKYNMPDISPLLAASRTVGSVLKKGDYVVFESTVYPGCTEDDCIPVLEEASGLKYKEDFFVGYSPERINPGDKEHTLKSVVKIVSGCCEEALENIAKTYEIVVEAGVHRAPAIKVAEAAKIIENTQRDVNIALMNELSIIFNRMGINTYDVLEAAGTKWNFLNFKPGLVGGHCIGVDPYYLAFKAQEYRYHPQIIKAGRFVNDTMGYYLAKQVVKKMTAQNKNILDTKVLIMGATFKENVSDIRNSRITDTIKEFKSYGVTVDIVDPYACPKEFKEEYGIEITQNIGNNYDAIVLAVNHKEYYDLDENYFKSISKDKAVFFDVKGIFRNKIKSLEYLSF
jgi:UDP-N-acetyl-D-galactosamine dehydrogenase